MSAATAHVEVLTAEVRTLVVGSRQVTLSVYKQLDEVGWPEMEAFGRVRTNAERFGWCELVGRSVETGSLVRASIQTGPQQAKWWFEEVYDGPPWCVVVGEKLYTPAGSMVGDLGPRRDFRANIGPWSVDVPRRWQVLVDGDDLEWNAWRFASGTEGMVKAAIQRCEQHKRDHDAAAQERLALPLIVLAGLK